MNTFTSSLAVAVLLVLFPGLAYSQIKFERDLDSSVRLQPVAFEQMGAGVIVSDFNNDGFEDLFLCGGQNDDSLYFNNGDGTFRGGTKHAGLADHGRAFTMGGVALDYDQDGWTDLYVTGTSRDALYRNNHDETFTNVTTSAGIVSPNGRNSNMTATFGDFDHDNDMDLYVARWIDSIGQPTYDENQHPQYTHSGLPNFFYVNNGNGTFTERGKEFGIDDIGVSTLSLFIDFDRDGDLDLLVGNDFGYYLRPNSAYRNMLTETGVAIFQRASETGLEPRLFSMGFGVSDFDRDGDFDFYLSNIGPEMLLVNEGGRFTDLAGQRKALIGHRAGAPLDLTTSWGPLTSDYDLDGWEDIFVVHGTMPVYPPRETYNGDSSIMLRNIGGAFQNVTSTSGLYTVERARGGATFDYDLDGDQDIVIGALDFAPINPSKGFSIWRNVSPRAGRHWLEVKLKGIRCGREAIGAVIEVWQSFIRYTRQVTTGGSFLSQNSLTQHFGLGDRPTIDSVIVYWPGGTRDKLENVAADRLLTITEGETRSVDESHPSEHLRLAIRDRELTVVGTRIGQRFELYNLIGSLVLAFNGTAAETSIRLDHLSRGYYQLLVSGEQSRAHYSLILQ